MLSAYSSLEDFMQTSRFQLGLVATLAVGLGFSLSSSDAIGYPAGSPVSIGTNPLWAVGGNHFPGIPVDIITAPSDQDIVVTDVLMTFECTGCTPTVILRANDKTISRTVFRHFRDGGNYATISVPIRHTFSSGLPVPAGETLTMEVSSHSVDYTLSGYYAQP
jgi:hypothetical protein